MKNYRFASIVFMLIISACTTTDQVSLTVEQQASIKQEVHATFDAYISDLNSKNIDAVVAHYSEAEGSYWVENGHLTYPTGKDAVDASRKFLPSLQEIELKASNVMINVLSKQQALLFADYDYHMVFSPEFALDLKGAMTILLEKQESRWVFFIGHTSEKKEDTPPEYVQ